MQQLIIDERVCLALGPIFNSLQVLATFSSSHKSVTRDDTRVYIVGMLLDISMLKIVINFITDEND